MINIRIKINPTNYIQVAFKFNTISFFFLISDFIEKSLMFITEWQLSKN